MNKLKNRFDKIIIISFVLNGFIAFCSFIFFMIKNSGLISLSCDFDAQEIAFNIFANNSIKNGQVFYNWSIDIGSDFLSSFSFYNLGSPFFWVTLLFPATVFPYLMGWIYMLKYAVAGLTSYLYLRQYVQNKWCAVAGSVLYAFCGFQAANIVFYHFHDAVAFFPLLLLGLDYMIQTKKRGYMAITVCINALVNWNFFIGEVIFLILYYIFRYSFVKQIMERNWKDILEQILHCLFEGILGVGMASLIFIPSVYSILSNSRISNHILGEKALVFSTRDYLQFIKALLWPNEILCNQSVLGKSNWYSIAAYLPMIGITFVLVYFYISEKDWIRKFLMTLLAIAIVPVLNNMFTLFNVESYRRWYYMPILIMVLASIKILEMVETSEKVRKLISKACIIVLCVISILVIYFKFYKWSEDKPSAINQPKTFLAYLGLGIIGIIATMILTRKYYNKKYFYQLFIAFIGLVSCANIVFNVIRYQKYSDFSSTKEVYNEIVNTSKDLQSDIIPYRYSMSDPYYNRNLAGSLTSIDSFISTVDSGIFKFYDSIKCPRHNMTREGPDGTAELLSVKYYETEEKLDSVLSYKVYNNGSRDVYVYEDDNALPIGFTYNSYITKSEFEQLAPELMSWAMLHTLVVPDEMADEVSTVLWHDDLKGGSILSIEQKKQDILERRTESSIEFYHSTTEFTSNIYTNDKKYAFFSVPYSQRWSATVNDKKVEIVDINGLMAVPVEKGNNIIKFTYSTFINKVGITISVVSVAIFFVIIIGEKISKHYKKYNNEI